MGVIVYGPQACGKTRMALQLANHFKMRNVVDGAQWPKTPKQWAEFKASKNLLIITDTAVPPRVDKLQARRIHWFADVMDRMHAGQITEQVTPPTTVEELFGTVPGYESLANVLARAYQQSSVGKGNIRHAQRGEPFVDQVIMDGAKRFGTGALIFQAYKKAEESQRLDPERGVNELLGAIVYLAAAVLDRERRAQNDAV